MATMSITIVENGYEVTVANDDGETLAMECRDFRGPEDPVKVAMAVGAYARTACQAMNVDPEWRHAYAQRHVDAHVYKCGLSMSRSMCGAGVDLQYTRRVDAKTKKRLNPINKCPKCVKLLDEYLNAK